MVVFLFYLERMRRVHWNLNGIAKEKKIMGGNGQQDRF